MKRLITRSKHHLIATLGALFCLGVTQASDPPIHYTDLAKAGFENIDIKKLDEAERAAFDKVYPPDEEMLRRVRLGPINPQPMNECIAGEAPPLADALENFPLHYPMTGRMHAISGVFEWQDKQLLFSTENQTYRVNEHHILYRLEQLGFTPKSDPAKATLDAVWTVNKIHGLQFLYVQHIRLD
jgi:hypothetical protein